MAISYTPPETTRKAETTTRAYTHPQTSGKKPNGTTPRKSAHSEELKDGKSATIVLAVMLAIGIAFVGLLIYMVLPGA